MTIEELDKLEHYHFIDDETELRWFYDHCVHKPLMNEVYAFCMSSRHKKLTEEERKGTGLGRSEMLNPTVTHPHSDGTFTYELWKKGIRQYECHKEAFTTREGESYPAKTLVIYMAINPSDELGVVRAFKDYLHNHEQELIDSARRNNSNVTLMNDLIAAIESGDDKEIKNLKDRATMAMAKMKQSGTEQSLYKVARALTKFKHLQFECVGTKYWVDFDMDIAKDFRGTENETTLINLWHTYLIQKFGKGNFVMIKTGGGLHTLVKKESIRFDPNKFLDEFKYYVSTGIEITDEKTVKDLEDSDNNVFFNGEPKNYKLSELAKDYVKSHTGVASICKNWLTVANKTYYTPSFFIDELVYNTNGFCPVPGTLQYGNLVKVVNKEDFN